jgi:hypothetical protein
MECENTLMRGYPLGPLCPIHGFIGMRKKTKRKWVCKYCNYTVEYDEITFKRWQNKEIPI